MPKKQLWLKLKNYHFDHIVAPNLWHQVTERFGGPDASTSAFAAKLARKLGWKNRFAILAIKEYKKFIFLGVVADFPVTPSAIIDKVWHEHLLFTKAYREFCSDVIDYPFDHNPELIPFDEQTENFQDQYLATIELYKSEFGIDPPPAIWGKTKFDPDKKINPIKKTHHTEQSTIYADSPPLITSFAGEMAVQPASDFSEFNGGDFGGAGAGSSFDSGSDSSGGDSSCSSCSSGCGGGD
jgi:hypothetical protein